jgi:tripartite motif-containing protein 56
MLTPKRLSPDIDTRLLMSVDGLSDDGHHRVISVDTGPISKRRQLLTSSPTPPISGEMLINEMDPMATDEDCELLKPITCNGGRNISLAQRLHDEFLICKICLEDYKSPKCLDCMHTFCEECIENHVFSESSYKKYSDYREFTCPLCRKRTQMPLGGVRKLPDNQVIRGVQTAVARRRPLSFVLTSASATCDICRAPLSPATGAASADGDTEKAALKKTTAPTGVPSPARCFDCNKSLCSACVAAHRSMPVTRLHSLYDPEVMSGVLQDPDALGCPDHRDETVGYYCVQCERCVCVLCALDASDGQPHHGHEIVDFGLAVTRYEMVLKDLCNRAAAEAARLRANLSAITACAETMENIRQQIVAASAELRRQIDAGERALLDRLTDVFGPDCQRLIEARPVVGERADRLESARQRAETVLEHRGVELLLLKKVIADDLEKEEKELIGGRTDEGSGGGGLLLEVFPELPGAVSKTVLFVPGNVHVGELCEKLTDDVADGGLSEPPPTPVGCQESGCRCRCHCDQPLPAAASGSRPSSGITVVRPAKVAVVDRSTMTSPAQAAGGDQPVMVDKGVNTKARGLLHSNGGGGKRPSVAASGPAANRPMSGGAGEGNGNVTGSDDTIPQGTAS